MPPTRLVPASLTVQSVVLVEGGGAAIEQWMELVQRRKRTDTGTLETMAACRGYSERLPPPLASAPPPPQNCTRLSPAELISAVLVSDDGSLAQEKLCLRARPSVKALDKERR